MNINDTAMQYKNEGPLGHSHLYLLETKLLNCKKLHKHSTATLGKKEFKELHR